MGATSPCYLCRRSTPRDLMVRQYVMKGFNGRRKSGHVLMCASCAGVPGAGPSTAPLHGPTGGSTMQEHNAIVAIISLIGMALIAMLVVAVRGR